MIRLNSAGGPPKSLWVLVRRAAYDTMLRKRRELQDYGGKLEGHGHSQKHWKPPGAGELATLPSFQRGPL